jgi:hypothetical protein
MVEGASMRCTIVKNMLLTLSFFIVSLMNSYGYASTLCYVEKTELKEQPEYACAYFIREGAIFSKSCTDIIIPSGELREAGNGSRPPSQKKVSFFQGFLLPSEVDKRHVSSGEILVVLVSISKDSRIFTSSIRTLEMDHVYDLDSTQESTSAITQRLADIEQEHQLLLQQIDEINLDIKMKKEAFLSSREGREYFSNEHEIRDLENEIEELQSVFHFSKDSLATYQKKTIYSEGNKTGKSELSNKIRQMIEMSIIRK